MIKEKFDEINSLKSYDAEIVYGKMSEQQQEEIVNYVMSLYGEKPKNEVSLTILRLTYCSPYLSKNYEENREGFADFISAAAKCVFNRSDITYTSLFVNENFVRDVLKGEFKKNANFRNEVSRYNIMNKDRLLASIWQSYFNNPSTIKIEEVIKASDLYFNLYDGECKFSVQSIRNKNDEQLYELYQYMKEGNKLPDFLHDGYFDVDNEETLYKDGFFKTLTEHTKHNANYQQLKCLASYILNNTSSYAEIKAIWNTLQNENKQKINLLSMLKGINLSVKMSSETYKTIPDTIKNIIKEDPTKTESFMKSIVHQFLEDKIAKENISLTNEILKILKEDIKVNYNYKSNLLTIIKNYGNKDFFQKNNFKIEVVQNLIEIEKNSEKIQEIKNALMQIKFNSHIPVLMASIEKKQIRESIDHSKNHESIMKRRL